MASRAPSLGGEQVDASTGAKQVYLYRDAHGVPSGAALVGLESVDAALRMQVHAPSA